MPVTAIDLRFGDGSIQYPAGTPVALVPGGHESTGQDLFDCLKRNQKAYPSKVFRIVLLDGFQTVLPMDAITSDTRK